MFSLRLLKFNRTSSSKFSQLRRLSTYDDYDVVIVGGGMVGGSLACGLGTSPLCRNLKVGVIDHAKAVPLYPLPETPDVRVFSISPGSVNLLKAIGVWNFVEETKRATPFNKMKVWESAGTGSISFSDKRPIAHIIEHHVIQAFTSSKNRFNRSTQ
eukprot:TRINITY_DN6866_c0_g1_i1.p1 TRINITY_DN6866_c0_g1~~TRINITY_DN6866_c0_g1_i1.p1  ORF type:complete len:156 (+),score=16.26 TRINITY_DN6866_c0_g1_i1:40-507(+)